jgi:hypothetical protein
MKANCKSHPSRIFVLSLVFSLPFILNAQSIEKITFDPKDSTDGYYLAIQPASKKIEGTIVILTSFIPPQGLLTETKLHNTASVNNLLTIVASTKQKLYADNITISRLNSLMKDVITRFSVNTSKFALAGYDEAGSIALRYTELTYEHPSSCPVQPKAVFGIDTPVDLFELWHWSERQIKKNYWQGAVGDAKYYLDVMTKENGTIYNNSQKYKQLSPFDKANETTGNEQYLKNVAVRLYYDADIEWHLKNRRNSLYDTKIPDGSELINRLLLLGNNKAEFIASKQPGVRPDGTRHPSSISIVNEVDCIHWIKRSLDIFDHNTWIPPYILATPEGWGIERFSLPPDFAPQLTYKGVEDIRFTPGWGNVKSEEHWSYCFLWWLDGSPKIDAAGLQANLKDYYDGLVVRNTPAGTKPVATAVTVKKINTSAGDVETFNGTINMLDYHARQPMTLTCVIHVKTCSSDKHTAIFFELSPQSLTHPVWKKMNQLSDSFDCEK